MEPDFELLGAIEAVETIAVNLSIRERDDLKARFGGKRWRKLKGVALVRFPNGEVRARRCIGTRPTAWAGAK